MLNASILGAIRDSLLADSGVAAAAPGGVHLIESSANLADDHYPVVVLRWPFTRFEHVMSGIPSGSRQWLATPRVLIDIEVLRAEDAEPLADLILARLVDRPGNVRYGPPEGAGSGPSANNCYVQFYPVDFFLDDDGSRVRNQQGERQYQFTLALDCQVVRNLPGF